MIFCLYLKYLKINVKTIIKIEIIIKTIHTFICISRKEFINGTFLFKKSIIKLKIVSINSVTRGLMIGEFKNFIIF